MVSPQQILTTVMANIVVDKLRVQTTLNHFRFVFYHDIQLQRKCFFLKRDQTHDTKKEQALSITFSQYDWFISQNKRSRLATKLRDILTRAWRVQHCLDSYRQWQNSQSDDEITSNCKNSNLKKASARYRIELWSFFRSTRGK